MPCEISKSRSRHHCTRNTSASMMLRMLRISRRDSSRSEVVLVPSKFGDGATCMRALCEEVGTTRRTLFFVQFLFNRREGQPWTHRGKHVYIQVGWRHSILIRVYTLSCVYTLRFLSIFNIS